MSAFLFFYLKSMLCMFKLFFFFFIEKATCFSELLLWVVHKDLLVCSQFAEFFLRQTCLG